MPVSFQNRLNDLENTNCFKLIEREITSQLIMLENSLIKINTRISYYGCIKFHKLYFALSVTKQK